MRAVVLGAGGFIGHHLVCRLKRQGLEYVLGVDLKYPRFEESSADEFVTGDLRDPSFVNGLDLKSFDQIYQLAADMGGAGFVFTGDNDAEILHNSATINLNVLNSLKPEFRGRIFYSSSACIYPERNQLSVDAIDCSEGSAYPAAPDSEYGWEKLFSERLYLAFQRNFGIDCCIARFHNIFGPLGSWNDGREKAPAAICRKVQEVENGGIVEIWGSGDQARTFLYITQCLDGVEALMRSRRTGPYNIGSDELISIKDLVYKVAKIANKSFKIRSVPGPVGVMGRTSDNRLVKNDLNWIPQCDLDAELSEVYNWVGSMLRAENCK